MSKALWTQLPAYKKQIATLQKPKPIRKVSKHRAGRLVQYRKLAIAHLERYKHCHVCLELWVVNQNMKPREATQIHHLAGRQGSLLTDVRNFLAVCAECHRRIHDNPRWAMENFYLRSRA